MIIGKVVGTVVSTENGIPIDGARYMLVDLCKPNGETKGDFHVVLDLVGSGQDEMVMIAQSTSARETTRTNNKPVDAIIVGIIDMIDESDKVVYKK